jgi:murein DD-endopeptidase MepM/ murein hydrolase activator NlpD
LVQTHAQIWGTLRRYLAYTAAGFVVLGGVGAMEAARPPLVTAANASQATLRSSVSPQALLATIASDAPSWTQRLHFDLASNTVAPAAVAAASTPYYPAPDTAWSKGAPAAEPEADTAAVAPAPEAQDSAAPSLVASVIAAVLAQPDQHVAAPSKPEATITVAMSTAPVPVAQTATENAATTAPAATAAPASPAPAPARAADDSSNALVDTLNWIYDHVDVAPTTPATDAESAPKDMAPAAPVEAASASVAPPASAPVETADDAPNALVATLNWVYDRVDTPVNDYSAPEVVSAEAVAPVPAPAASADAPSTQTADASNTDTAPVLEFAPDLGLGTASPDSAAAVQDSFSPGAQKVIQVRRGDTLFKLLTNAGLSDAEAQDASHSLADVFSPSDLKVGQQITLNFASGTGPAETDGNKLLGLTLTPSVERDVKLTRDSEGQFVAAAVDRPLTERIDRAAGDIDISLFESAHDAGLPAGLIGDLIKAYSYDVDFQRDIHEGDSFEVLYERYDTPTGELAKPGKLLYASLTLGGKPMAIYYFERDGDGEYFTADGVAVRKSLLKTPIDGAKITSGYGMRVNPILG